MTYVIKAFKRGGKIVAVLASAAGIIHIAEGEATQRRMIASCLFRTLPMAYLERD